MKRLLFLALAAAALFAQQDSRRVLYVTHSAGFRHSSLELSQEVLREVATRTGRLGVVATEDLSFLTAERLRDFDAVFFYTSGELALSNQQKADLLEFVRSGKGFGGVHSATDTLYGWPEYGELIGGVFDGHPWVQEASIDIEDAQHPISQALAPAWTLHEEYYQFRSFSRDRVRVLMTLDTRTVDLNADGVNRTDKDFALAWVRRYGEGRVFYTALGHFEETWRDPRFQQMMSQALLWTAGLIDGEASPQPRSPSSVWIPEEVAPGAALELYGENLTTGSILQADGREWKYRLAGARVLVNDEEAPLYYASPSQLNVQFPVQLAEGSVADVDLMIGEKTFEAGRTAVVATAPAIRGVVAQSGFLLIYATGLGAVDADVATGAPAPLDRLVRTRNTPIVRVGGAEATVQFSGLAPGWVALYQVNAVLPGTLPPGNLEVELEIARRSATFPWVRE